MIKRFWPCLILIASILHNAQASLAADEANKTNDPVAITPPSEMVPDNLIWLDNGAKDPRYIFIADKENRTLTVWEHDSRDFKLYGAYPMDIGKNVGDKVAPGDAKTPEGTYFVQERLEGASLNFSDYGTLAFTLDYPNYFDKLARKSGSGIWLHAIPESKSLLRGSRGCVVVRNEIIQKLAPLITPKKTPVIIVNKVNYVTKEQLEASRNLFADWINDWKVAWQSKNIDAYIGHYADSFKTELKALKMNKSKWREYKNFLNKKYAHIAVEVNEPVILARKDEAIIRFRQNYESDGLKDVGEKTLFLKKGANNKYEILTEIWQPEATDTKAKN